MTALQTTPPANLRATPISRPLAGPPTPDVDQSASDAQAIRVDVGAHSRQADHERSDTHISSVAPVEALSPTSQVDCDAQKKFAGGGPISQQDDRFRRDAHAAAVVPVEVSVHDPAHGIGDIQLTSGRVVDLFDPILTVHAETVDDLERVRIANENRLRSFTTVYGLDDDHTDVARLAGIVTAMEQFEHQAVLNLQRAMRRHPLGPWVKAHRGVGPKQAARLLTAIGDPYWNTLHQRPRTVSELWAYCGMSVVNGTSQRHTKGQKGNWNDTARMRIWLIASAMPKFPGAPYEQLYRAAREKYDDATHTAPCPRCGPKGKPALPGSDLSDGHKHARAVRIVAKTILRDLWVEAKRLHEEASA